jgi:hypothetical protein
MIDLVIEKGVYGYPQAVNGDLFIDLQDFLDYVRDGWFTTTKGRAYISRQDHKSGIGYVHNIQLNPLKVNKDINKYRFSHVTWFNDKNNGVAYCNLAAVVDSMPDLEKYEIGEDNVNSRNSAI